MKPNFALKLSNDGIELLHRDSGGWLSLGAVSFETDDVEAGCARLVAEANRLEPGGIRSKLVLPESQLRYATVSAPGPTDEARRYQIEAEIEALTPYAIDELIYDWSVEDDHALVVICARDTLAEAEGFADASGFNPVAFVAAPQSGMFSGEPNFGLTSVSRAYVPSGERVQFDAEPVRVTGVARPAPAAKAEPVAPPAAKVEPDNRAADKATDKATDKAADTTATDTKAAASTPVERPVVAARAPVASPPVMAPTDSPKGAAPLSTPTPPPSEPFSKVGNLVRRMGTRLRREQAAEQVAQPATPPSTPARPAPLPVQTAPAARPVSGGVSGGASGAAPAQPKAAPVARPAPGTQPAAPNAAPARPRPALGTGPVGVPSGAFKTAAVPRPAPGGAKPWVTDSRPAGTGDGPEAAPISFASRRRPEPVAGAGIPGDRSADANPGGRIAVLPGDRDHAGPSLATRLNRRAKRTARALLARVRGGEPAPGQGRAETGAQPNGAAGATRRATAAAGPLVPGSRPASDRDKATEAEALTIFGARGNIRPEPSLARRGLMAGGAVVLLLVAVAVWFTYFNTSDQGTQLAGDGGVEGSTQTAPMPDIAAPQQIETATDATGLQAPVALPDNSGVAPTPLPTEGTEAIADATAALPETTAAETAAETATPEGVTAEGATDPDALLESLVQQALNEALPTEALDRAAQVTEEGAGDIAAADDTATPAVEQAETAAATVDAAQPAAQPAAQGTTEAQLAQGGSVPASDTPQVAAATETATQVLTLPTGLDVPDVSEVAFDAPPPPPPFGTQFTLNDNGLVEATREGALTPSGVTVFARRPAVAPAPRPAGIAPEPVAAPVVEAPVAAVAEAPVPVAPVIEAPEVAPVANVVPDDTPRADPALAAARPQPRSARVQALGEQLAPATPEPEPGAAPGTPVEQQNGAADLVPETDTAALETPPPGGVSLAGLRPQTRPTDLVPPVGEITAEEAEEIDTEGATAEAVAASLRPSARPSDITERAQAILASAGSSAAGSRTDAENDEGETASTAAAPAIPSSASVARQATETGAINLREVNLIGVFGTPSERRALVRLSSGRVVRVRVGDRLDGGQVTAIGDAELRYTKNGRNEVLEIGG